MARSRPLFCVRIDTPLGIAWTNKRARFHRARVWWPKDDQGWDCTRGAPYCLIEWNLPPAAYL